MNMKNKEKIKKTSIGGQAVIEGVMMRGASSMATAVRDESGQIILETKRVKPPKKHGFLSWPLVRGAVAFVNSLVTGTKALTRSASVFGEDETSKFDDWLSKKTGISSTDIAVFIGVVLGLVLSIFLFFFLPQFIVGFMPFLEDTPFLESLFEGLIRIAIFLGYILLTSLLKDIKRTYMYHGAEHKTISCYEKGLELNVENVRKCTRLHDRCGTTFTFLVMAISILIFAIVNYFLNAIGIDFSGFTGKLLKFLVKLVCLPLVAGVSYEILKLLAKTQSKWVIIFKAPGLLLQKITTSEPTDDMIEVAITAFKKVLEMDNDQTIPESTFEIFGSIKNLTEKVTKELENNNIDKVDGEWIVNFATKIQRSKLYENNITVTKKQYDLAINLLNERLTGKPLQYVLKSANFYGYDFYVDENVLIPRSETEELCMHALKFINAESKVLDMCTGSGAIGITVNLKTGANVTLADISEKALEVASKNAKDLNANVFAVNSDLFTNIEGEFDVILSNPPYIKTADLQSLQTEVKYEPTLALDGGIEGLDYYYRIENEGYSHLKKGGIMILEFGIDESEKIFKIFDNTEKYTNIEIKKDINGIDRFIKVEKQ